MERSSSMENEPRTLNFHQIEFAREAALYVVNTRSVEEATSIFTEGLERVGMCRFRCSAMNDVVSDDEKKMKLREEDDRHDWSACNTCSGNSFLRVSSVRDIVSAPF